MTPPVTQPDATRLPDFLARLDAFIDTEALRGVVWHHRLGRNPPEHWFKTLGDVPGSDPVREEIRLLAREVS